MYCIVAKLTQDGLAGILQTDIGYWMTESETPTSIKKWSAVQHGKNIVSDISKFFTDQLLDDESLDDNINSI